MLQRVQEHFGSFEKNWKNHKTEFYGQFLEYSRNFNIKKL